MVECVRLEVPDGLGEEAGADEEEEVGHDDQEDGESCKRQYETFGNIIESGEQYSLVRLAKV